MPKNRPRLATLVAFFVTVSTLTFAQCSAPASAGARICTPTAGATVAYPVSIQFNSRAASAASIKQLKVYDNGREVYATSPGQTGATLVAGGTQNGEHQVTVEAWDTAGHVYKSTTNFRVIGEGLLRSCAVPSTGGVNFCSPQTSDTLGVKYPVVASAKGVTTIASIAVLLDGKLHSTVTGQNQITDEISVPGQGYHEITILAKDQAGHTYNASRVLHSAYTYGDFQCDEFSCAPGILADKPAQDAYVGHTFGIDAKVMNATHRVTAMKAYLDGTAVASSSAASLSHMVTTALNGTHVVTVQAWDSTGAVYRVQYNVNINVAH